MSGTRHAVSRPMMIGLGLLAIMPVPTMGQDSLADRISPTDPSTYRQAASVHAGAGPMALTSLLGRGAVGPLFHFMHRGEIPPGGGIGHHFHNTVEEMFLIFDGEAQFTINGRTAVLKGPAGALNRLGNSHAIYNSSSQTVQWMNLQVGSVEGVSDAFDLIDGRENAVLDPVPAFISISLDPALIGSVDDRGRRGGDVDAAVTEGVRARRVLSPTAFASAWSYIDHILVEPGASTPLRTHADIGEAYYVLNGSGTVTVGMETAPVTKGDAIPVRLDEASSFSNTSTEPLELFVLGVARDMDTKRRFMMEGNRQRE